MTSSATQVVAQPRKGVIGSEAAIEYWSKYFRTVLTPLFESVGGYTRLDQETQLEFLKKHVAPIMGPVPAEPYNAYNMPYIPSPVETSVNLSTLLKAKARIWMNLGKPLDRSRFEPGAPEKDREALRNIAKATGADSRWMESLMDSLFPSPSELEAMRAAEGPVWPFSLFCFDFDGSERTMRAYFPVVPTDGRSRTQVCLDAIDKLEPRESGLQPALDLVTGYLSDNNYDAALHMLGVDCLEPERARLKIYMDINSNSWNAVKDVMTLGGRLTDETTLEGIKVLHSIYPLMRDEPDCTDDDWSKPAVIPQVSFPGLQLSMEIVAGNAIPEIKIYSLMLQWTKTSEKAEANMIRILQKLNHEWGSNGKLTSTREAAVGPEHRGLGAVTFSYSKKKGAYTTFYFDPPSDYDDKVAVEFRGLYKA